MTTTDERLEANVKNIADTLSNPEEWQKEFLEDNPEEAELGITPLGMEWLRDVLDIRYIVNSEGQFISAQVLVAFGGPNIWVNFDTKTVEGYWGGDRATAYFTDELGIEDALEELWSTR